MELGLYQRQTMRLSMTQELRQAISILQYTKQELLEFLREQALENPLIELKEPSFEDGRIPRNRKIQEEQKNWIERIGDTEGGLREELLQQLRCQKMKKTRFQIASYLVECLDDDGYLAVELERVARELNEPLREVEAALVAIQSLEPAGVGARTLEECLLLQIKEDGPVAEAARQIITHHLHLLMDADTSHLADQLSLPTDIVQQAVQRIRMLHPRPGASHSKERPQYVIPDISVERENGTYIVKFYDHYEPKVTVNDYYRYCLTTGSDKEANKFLRKKYRHASWLIHSIEQRRETLFRVTQAIVQKQPHFFINGPEALVPMTLKEIADIAQVHESTVSRAVNGKYAQTPVGVFELRAFFTQGLKTASGCDVSTEAVKERIKRLIMQEDRQKPYSDEKIARVLSAEGISISRRTVAKYRKMMNIPSSAKRKKARFSIEP